MMLQTRQKKLLLDQLTEDNSPFRDNTTHKIFKNTANLSLHGGTYDAKHLDKFLNSQYCSSSGLEPPKSVAKPPRAGGAFRDLNESGLGGSLNSKIKRQMGSSPIHQ